MLSLWACLIFAVHVVEGVVKEVIDHAKEAGEKGKAKFEVQGSNVGCTGRRILYHGATGNLIVSKQHQIFLI